MQKRRASAKRQSEAQLACTKNGGITVRNSSDGHIQLVRILRQCRASHLKTWRKHPRSASVDWGFKMMLVYFQFFCYVTGIRLDQATDERIMNYSTLSNTEQAEST